jgi:hypothetical protein
MEIGGAGITAKDLTQRASETQRAQSGKRGLKLEEDGGRHVEARGRAGANGGSVR